MVMPGLINLDFADVRTVMCEMGTAMMGMGEAEGERRALEAADAAISNPLLDHSSMKGARGVLINITGGMDLTLYEVDEAANKIRSRSRSGRQHHRGLDLRRTDERTHARVGRGDRHRAGYARSHGAVEIGEGDRRRPPPGEYRRSDARTAARAASSTSIGPTHDGHRRRIRFIRCGRTSCNRALPHRKTSDIGGGIRPIGLVPSSSERRGHGGVESHVFDPGMIDAIGPDPQDIQLSREIFRPRTSQHAMPAVPEAKKSGSFSILGISIGPSAEEAVGAAFVERIAELHAAAIRIEFAAQVRRAAHAARAVARWRTTENEIRRGVFSAIASDDQLDIPAFLRRQAN